MTHREDSSTVHVVGGGIAGLAAAAFVARAGRPVVVHEQRGRLGGRATTDERQGFRFNQGPHALYVGGEASSVLAELDIRPTGVTPAARGARMVSGGTSYLAPNGTPSLMATRLLGLREKADLARILTRIGRIDSATLADLTVDDWLARLTDRQMVADVLRSLVRLTTYANAPRQLSADVAARQIQLGLSSGVLYLDGGWERMVGHLADAVTTAGGRIEVGDPVNELPEGAAVIIATGGPALAAKLTGHDFVCGPAAAAAVLDLALVAPAAHRFVIGVDEPIYLSDHSHAADMAPAGRASVALAQYLAPDGEVGSEPSRERLRAFAAHGGITDQQIIDERYLHRMATITAIPTAALGGLDGRPTVEVPDIPGVFVAGDWVGARGHLADAALSSAREAAGAAVRHLERRAVA